MGHLEEKKTEVEAAPRKDGFQFGHYFLEKRLAHGGMAEVFVGRDIERPPESDRCVVKCILPDLATDPQFLAMFINEAQLAAQIDHPNVVKVLDFGEQDGLLYMAMEYVDGLDCWRFARRVHPFGEDHEAAAAFIIAEVLDGLDHVHNLKDVNGHPLHVVHRDMSPSNIYLSLTGDVKLGDFGIARIDSPRYRKISYSPRGKFGYVAPEQIERGVVDRRADIFAAGIVLAELVIGKKLFRGPSQLGVLLEIRDGRYTTLEQNADRISKQMRSVIYKALARSPSDRYQTAAAFRDALIALITDADAVRKNLAGFVENAREIGDTRRSLAVIEKRSDESADASEKIPTDALVDAIELYGKSGRQSLVPTNPNRLTPTVWDIIGEEPDDLDDFESIEDLDDLEDETPITSGFDPETVWEYTVELGLNEIEGPLSFAKVMELICEERIRPDTLVSLNGGPFAPAAQYPELLRHIPEYTPTLDVEEIRNPDRRGVLAVTAPPEVVLSLAFEKETGLLVCKLKNRRKEVYFKDGSPVYASSNETKELLGEYLVAEGVLGQSQLDTALELLPRFDGHMGDTLVALGLVSAVDLFRAISDQIRMRFKDLLFWHEGVYEFYRGAVCKTEQPEIAIDAYQFVGETLTQFAETLDADRVFTELKDAVLDRTQAAAFLSEQLSVSEAVYTHFTALMEPTTVATSASKLKDEADKKSFLTALYIAVETGIWSIEGPRLPWRRPMPEKSAVVEEDLESD